MLLTPNVHIFGMNEQNQRIKTAVKKVFVEMIMPSFIIHDLEGLSRTAIRKTLQGRKDP